MHLTPLITLAAGMLDGLMLIPFLTLPVTFGLACAEGALVGRCVHCVPEARAKCLSEVFSTLLALIVSIYISHFAGLTTFSYILAIIGFLLMIAMKSGGEMAAGGMLSLLTRDDWTPLEEEIALRPIRLLVDRENYRQALGELEELLKKRKPTYEAQLLKAKLLNHIGRIDEARTALLGLIALSATTQQQLSVMEMLSTLDDPGPEHSGQPSATTRRIEIRHELILLPMTGGASGQNKEIPAGTYEVAELIRDKRLWFKLPAEDWGNAAECWMAVLATKAAAAAPIDLSRYETGPMERFLSRIFGKSARERRIEASDLFRQAAEFARREEWSEAAPLLEKAATADPDRFEISYRWAMAVRQSAGPSAAAAVVSRVLEQTDWSKSEQDMLKQLCASVKRL